MNIVFFVSLNGIGPCTILGCLIDKIKLLYPESKYIFKTENLQRFHFVKYNYLKNLDYAPKYNIKYNDIVIHVIDPRNIPTIGIDVFIDNIGDYWHYIDKHKLYLERLLLYYLGIANSDRFYITGYLNTYNRTSQLEKFAFVDKYIKKAKINNKITKCVLFIGSFKEKNIVFDNFIKKSNLFIFKKTTDRKSIVSEMIHSEVIVTHPGINTISESLYLRKPFVYIEPANLEQELNLNIVKKYGLGVTLKKFDSCQIIKKINRLKKYYDIYRRNIDYFVKYNRINFDSKLDCFLNGMYNDIKGNL